MSAAPELWLARHGETEWTLSRRHTGVTDLPLTPHGEDQARTLGRRLAGHGFARVLSSQQVRARRTAEIAGFGPGLELDPDLREWDYGDYEGVTTAEIEHARPDWDLWRDGCPGGETLTDLAARADRVLECARRSTGDVLVFGHGHALRVLAARALDLDATAAAHLLLSPAALSIIASDRGEPAIELWNDTGHEEAER